MSSAIHFKNTFVLPAHHTNELNHYKKTHYIIKLSRKSRCICKGYRFTDRLFTYHSIILSFSAFKKFIFSMFFFYIKHLQIKISFLVWHPLYSHEHQVITKSFRIGNALKSLISLHNDFSRIFSMMYKYFFLTKTFFLF